MQALRDSASSDAFEAAEAFRSRAEDRLDKYESDPQCFTYQLKACEAIAQLQLEHFPLDYFEYLAKAQHAASTLSTLKFLNKKLNPDHKFSASQRLL